MRAIVSPGQNGARTAWIWDSDNPMGLPEPPQTIRRRGQLGGETENSPYAVARIHSGPEGLMTKLYFRGPPVSPPHSRPRS
jgi:hypothetical protein